MHNTSLLSDSKILDHLLEYTNDLIMIFNEKGESEVISASVNSILGYEREELIGKPYTLLIHPDDVQTTSIEKENIHSGEGSFNFENRCFHKNGSIVYLQWTSSYDPHSKKIYGIARDITATKLKEESEKQQNEINKALINGTNTLVWSLDKNYCFTGFNKAFKESREEEYLATIEIGINTFESMNFPRELINEWKPIYDEVFNGKSLDFEYNTAHLEKNRSNVKWHKIELKPIISNNEVIGLLGSSTDITELKITAEELKGRNNLIEKVLQEIPLGVAVNDINSGKPIFINKQFTEAYNWSLESIQDVPDFLNKIYSKEDKEAQKVSKMVNDDIERREPIRMQWENIAVRGQDNLKRYVNAKNIPLYEEGLMISTVINNTETYLNKLALESAYIEKNEILNGISDAFYTLDNDYNFTFLNKHSLEIMGMSADELIGRNIFEVFPELKPTQFFQQLELVKQTGDSSKFEFYYNPFDRWFDERIYKSQLGFSVFFVDITVKKMLRLKLESSYAEQNEILESITDAFIALDDNYCFTYVNQEAENVFGINKAELLGENLKDIFPSAYNSKAYKKFNKTLLSNDPCAFEYFYKPTQQWFFINCYPSGLGLSVYFRNTTKSKTSELELKKLNTSLKQKNEELEQFAFVASHDLQEPLRTISSFMDLLKRHLKEHLDETSEQYINYAIEGSLRMKQIILDLLDYSRAGADDDEITEINCNHAVSQIKDLLEDSINSKGGNITSDQLPTLNFNHTAFRQVMMNFITNALKYVEKGVKPSIHISCQNNSDHYEFHISDNGIGIEEEYFDQIFTIFKRLHNRNQFSGTGIGLAICKKIVEKYGGTILVDSTIGKGTTFSFTVLKNIEKTTLINTL